MRPDPATRPTFLKLVTDLTALLEAANAGIIQVRGGSTNCLHVGFGCPTLLTSSGKILLRYHVLAGDDGRSQPKHQQARTMIAHTYVPLMYTPTSILTPALNVRSLIQD